MENVCIQHEGTAVNPNNVANFAKKYVDTTWQSVHHYVEGGLAGARAM